MNEKINTSMGESYNIATPTSNASGIIGGITKITTSVTKQVSDKFKNFSTTVEEMDLGLSNDNIEVTSIISSEDLTQNYLKAMFELITNNINELNTEKSELEAKYNEFLSKIPDNSKLADMMTSFSVGDIAMYNPNVYNDMYIKQLDTLNIEYINEHSKEFEEFMGMTLEEYNQKLLELDNQILSFNSYEYMLRQQEKEYPYLCLMQTEEYQNYLSNMSETNVTPRMPAYEPPPVNLDFEYNDAVSTGYYLQYQLKVSNLEYLQDYQVYMYNYLFDTKGEQAAFEYLEAIEDSINQAKGREEAEEFLSKITDEKGNIDVGLLETFLITTGKGLGNGVENFGEGLENLFDFTSDGVKTDNQYAQMFILQAINELQDDEKVEIIDFLDDTYQISTSIGNMLPGMALSALTTPTVGQILMGMSAAGNSKNDALISGANIVEAYMYGAFSGASETVVGRLMGNIPFLNENAKFAFKGILSEGAEELTQTYVDAGLRAMVLGENVDITDLSLHDEALKSFLYGCVTSGIMTGGQAAINFTIGGVQYSYDNINELFDAYKAGKIATVNTSNVNNTNSNTINDPTDDSAITKANYYTAKGITQTFRFSSAEHIPAVNSNFWTAFNNPELIQINVDGKLMTLDEAISYKMNYDLNSNGVEIDMESKGVINNDSKVSNTSSIEKLMNQANNDLLEEVEGSPEVSDELDEISVIDDVETEKLFDYDGSQPTVDLFATEKLMTEDDTISELNVKVKLTTSTKIESSADFGVTEEGVSYFSQESSLSAQPKVPILQSSLPVTSISLDGVSKTKIPCTDIDVVTPFSKQIAQLDGTYEKYLNTDLPAEMVIDSLEILKQIGSGDARVGLDILVEDKGMYSIESITARGTLLQNYLKSNPIRTDMSLTSEDFASRARDVFKSVGLDGMDVLLSKEFKRIYSGIVDGSIIVPQDMVSWDPTKVAAELACESIFSEDFEYWQVKDDVIAMKKFTGIYYDDFNSIMRKFKDGGNFKEFIRQFSKQLAEGVGFQERTIIYRGLWDLDWIANGALRGLYGKELCDAINNLGGGIFMVGDNGFESSTPVMGQGFTSLQIVEVTSCPKGVYGSYIGKNSSCSEEIEYTLNAGVGNQKVILGAEYIDDKILVYTEIVE